VRLQIVREVLNPGRPTLLAALSFLRTTNLSTHYLAMSSARCRHPRRATRSSPRLQKPPSHTRRCARRTTTSAAGTALPRPTGAAHARPRRQRWGQRKRNWRRTETPQFDVLLRTRRCCGVSSWHAGPQLVRGARDAPERHPGRVSATRLSVDDYTFFMQYY